MQSQRNLLLIGFLLVTFMLWQSWMVDDAKKNAPQAPVATAESSVPTSSTSADVPNQADNSSVKRALLTLRSDVLELTVDTLGGDIVEAKLLKQMEAQNSDKPFVLLEKDTQRTYIAQSGLIGRDGIDNQATRPLYTADGTTFAIQDGKDELVVPMSYTDSKGNVFTKRFVLKRDSYAINVDYQVKNTSAQPLEVQFYGQLKQSIKTPDSSSPGMMASAFHGAAYSTEEQRYEKVKFDSIGDNKLNITTQGGWAGMLQHYFVSAWVGKQDTKNTIYTNTVGINPDVKESGDAIIGVKLPVTTVAANSDAVVGTSLWIGPKLQEQMAAVANHLDLTVDYGYLWFIAQPLFKLLKFLHSVVGNWGLAIILITLIVRGGMYPLSKAQYTSMAKMRLLQPKLTALRERLGDDRQKMSQAMMELYKEEKVNPLGGCFPLLIQMPIFIALYWTLMESVELRHAPFALWLTDLSVKDPFYVLPLLMGATMWYIQKMSPTTVTDPMQQKIMQFMPIIFTFMFLWFPSGLTLYWVVSNIVTITQQTIIFRQLEKKGLHSRKK